MPAFQRSTYVLDPGVTTAEATVTVTMIAALLRDETSSEPTSGHASLRVLPRGMVIDAARAANAQLVHSDAEGILVSGPATEWIGRATDRVMVLVTLPEAAT